MVLLGDRSSLFRAHLVWLWFYFGSSRRVASLIELKQFWKTFGKENSSDSFIIICIDFVRSSQEKSLSKIIIASSTVWQHRRLTLQCVQRAGEMLLKYNSLARKESLGSLASKKLTVSALPNSSSTSFLFFILYYFPAPLKQTIS